jgi:starvation-inducible DNA-binding protein
VVKIRCTGRPYPVVARCSLTGGAARRVRSLRRTTTEDTYAGVITDHRAAAEEFAEIDPVSEDLLIGQLGELELFAWFLRSHLGR